MPKGKKVQQTDGQPNLPAVATSHFLLFIGGSFYDKEGFIKEASEQGISRRMPTWRVPSDLAVGESKVWVATGGKRSEQSLHQPAEVFGYFIPDAVEFIAGEDGEKQYSDVISGIKKVKGGRIIWSVKGERKRLCGYRKVGGTYIVTDKETSPLVLVDPQPFEGNHFRGIMRLTEEQAQMLEQGKGLNVLELEQCFDCGVRVLVSPDGARRAERERRRMEKGETPKWKIQCPTCRKQERAAKKAAEKAAKEDAEKAVEAEAASHAS